MFIVGRGSRVLVYRWGFFFVCVVVGFFCRDGSCGCREGLVFLVVLGGGFWISGKGNKEGWCSDIV